MLIFVARIAGLLLLQSGRLNSMKRTITTQDACRPNAFTYCELPIITSLSEEPYPAFPGEELRIHCQAYGSPMPVIAWFRILANGESIDIPNTTGAHMINEAGTLRMKHVVPHDDGKYFCVASNSVGDSKALIEIKVTLLISTSAILY
jgi:Immunoglobulin I-set domain